MVLWHAVLYQATPRVQFTPHPKSTSLQTRSLSVSRLKVAADPLWPFEPKLLISGGSDRHVLVVAIHPTESLRP